jgi:hypothetical protein
MFRGYLTIFVLASSLFFQGCGLFGTADRGSKDETEESKTSKAMAIKEVDRLRIENLNLQEKINTLVEEKREIKATNLKEIESLKEQCQAQNAEFKRLREENQRLSDENKVLIKKLATLQVKKGVRKAKVKVLSGDGNILSAKKMAGRLEQMGYSIKIIGYAPRSNFSNSTVYFAPKFRDEGRRLLTKLGPKAILKPLTWSSIFDLIVVTGKKR